MIVMESFIVMSLYQLQIVVNVIKSLSDVHPYLSHISVLKRSVSQHRYLYTYRFTSLCNFFFVVSYLLLADAEIVIFNDAVFKENLIIICSF